MTPVVFAIPTANPVLCAETFGKWSDMGFTCVALVDGKTMDVAGHATMRVARWHGYPVAVNLLCHRFAEGADWIVTGGDDIDPDPNRRAKDIAQECSDYFAGTLGVMQPTGDPHGKDEHGTVAAARICGSPWLGREFIRRANLGVGPFWQGYNHFYCDEELKETASRDQVLWQRPELCQMHRHWSFEGRPRPEYMNKAQAGWDRDKAIFDVRKAHGFPGSHLLTEDERVFAG
jgi:hypothetical protein